MRTSDFHADLEAQLRAAAHARAAGTLRPRRRWALRPVLVFAATAGAAVIALAWAVSALRVAEDVAPVPLPAAGVASSCAEGRFQLRSLAIFGRPRRDGDVLPPAVARRLRADESTIRFIRSATRGLATFDFYAFVAGVCGLGGPGPRDRGVCLVAIYQERERGSYCTLLPEHRTPVVDIDGGIPVVLGIAPARARSAVLDDGRRGVRVHVAQRILADVALLTGRPLSLTSTVELAYEGADGHPVGGGSVAISSSRRVLQTVAVLNATTTPGLGAAVARRIPRDFTADFVGNYSSHGRRRSVVYALDSRDPGAEQVARALGIDEVRPATLDQIALADGAGVIVVVGADLRRMR